jgi:hypothetical protein
VTLTSGRRADAVLVDNREQDEEDERGQADEMHERAELVLVADEVHDQVGKLYIMRGNTPRVANSHAGRGRRSCRTRRHTACLDLVG